ncbi:MAG TPA: hypothetical protein VGT98_17435 [Candidatus Elarobacter sp.]|nr:hypothetical protein [Candidatus Elarobacter sp.]
MNARLKLLSRRTIVSPALAMLALVAACSSGDSVTGPQTTGQFNAAVTGAVQTSLAGSAALVPVAATVVDSVQVPQHVVLGLVDKGGVALVAFQWQGTTTVAPGTYKIGQGTGDVAMVFDTGTGAAGGSFDGASGTIVINGVTGGTATGTFTAAATAQDTGAQVTVSGSFTAPTVSPSTSP